jgi:hypothetical protein
MAPSNGTHSYVLNSSVQSLAIQCLHPILKDAINHFKLPKDGSIRVALDALLVQIFLFLQISYPLGFLQMVLQRSNIFSMIFQEMISIYFFQQIPPFNLRCGGNDNYFDVNCFPLKLGFGRNANKAEKKIDT